MMDLTGPLYKKGLARASRAAREAAECADDLRGLLLDIAERYKRLAEQQKGWRPGSQKHHRVLEDLSQQVRDIRNRARELRTAVPKR